MREFALNQVTLVLVNLYGPYMSIKAIRSEEGTDDIQWLMFWCIYSLLVALDTFSDFIHDNVPFYHELKLAFIVYCMFFKGAEKVYKTVVEPLFVKNESRIDAMLSDLPVKAMSAIDKVGNKAFLQSAKDDPEKFKKRYGKRAYETALRAMEHSN